MAINFPDNPTIGDEFTATTGRTWIWTGSTWKSKTVNLEAYISDTTNVHGISDTADLVYQSDLTSKQDVVPNVTDTEIGYLANVTSDIQDQIDGKSATTHTHTIDDVTDVTVTATEINYLSGTGSNIQLQIDGKSDSTHTHPLTDITDVTATVAEVNILDGATVTTTELNYLSGATSSIQTQLSGKSDTGHTHDLQDVVDVTATATELNVLDGITATTTELNYLDGVTSSIQDQIDSKAASTHTHSLADVTDVTASSTEVNVLDGITSTTTQLNYLNTLTSNVQDQIDAKANLSGATFTGFVTLHSDPTQALHAATKEYVDNIASGIVSKPATYAATTANLDATYSNGTDGVGATLTATSNGAFPVIDGVQLTTSNGYRGILVKNQTNAAHNGRYNLTTLGDANTPWVLTKCSLCDTANEIPGSYIFVTDGAANGGTGWVLYVDDPATFTVGTDAVYAFQFSGSGTYSAGSGLELSGNQFAVDFDVVAPLASPAFTGTVDMSGATVNGMYLTADAFENVNLASLATNDLLVYDGTNWVNKYVNSLPAKITAPTPTSNNYTLVSDDLGKIVEINSSSATTVTLPSSESYPVGSQIVIMQTGVGSVSVIVQNSGSQTLNYSPGNVLRDQWSAATLLKRASNTWVLYGDLAE